MLFWYVTSWTNYIYTNTVPINTKLGTIATYYERLFPLKLHDPLIRLPKWGHTVFWKSFISIFTIPMVTKIGIEEELQLANVKVVSNLSIFQQKIPTLAKPLSFLIKNNLLCFLFFNHYNMLSSKSSLLHVINASSLTFLHLCNFLWPACMYPHIYTNNWMLLLDDGLTRSSSNTGSTLYDILTL